MLSYAKLAAVAAKALTSGGALRVLPGGSLNQGTVVDWHVQGACLSAKEVLLAATTTRDGTLHRLRVYLTVRCRQCKPCLEFRAMNWRERVQREIAASSRTWFGTLTFTPLQHRIADVEIAREILRGYEADPDLSDDDIVKTVLSVLSPKELWIQRQRKLGREVTLYMKRLREALNVPLRYFIVTERHKRKLANRPHFHLVVHEQGVPIRKAQLKASWCGGHISFKLADMASAHYVTKYLTKESSARVRASFRYGHDITLSNGSNSDLVSNSGQILQTTTTTDDERRKFTCSPCLAMPAIGGTVHDDDGARLPDHGVQIGSAGFQVAPPRLIEYSSG